VNTAYQVAELGEGLGRGVAGLKQQRPRRGGILVEHLLGGAQRHAHRHQPGLRSVVQVPLDPADLRGTGVHHFGAALRQVRHLLL